MKTESSCSPAALREKGSRLSPDAARWAVLLEVFNGDAQAWVDYLLEHGSRRQLKEDLPFAIRVAMGDAFGVA